MNFGGWEIIAVLFIVLLLFGSTRLPQLAKGMGKSIREFKKGIADGGEDEIAASSTRSERLRSAEADRLIDEEVEDEKVSSNKRL
jgi:sec-independent protein translocase protein TatA